MGIPAIHVIRLGEDSEAVKVDGAAWFENNLSAVIQDYNGSIKHIQFTEDLPPSMGGPSLVPVVGEVPTRGVDNRTFTTLNDIFHLAVYRQGLRMKGGVGYDYVQTGDKEFTFNYDVPVEHWVTVDYFNDV